jgi:hypothetical protein
MKQRFFLLVGMLLLLQFIAIGKGYAQSSRVDYTYDQAGNRTARLIIYEASLIKKYNQPTDSVVIKDQLAGLELKFYPNPTKGMLRVEINGSEADSELNMVIYDAQGRILLNSKANEGTNTLDLTRYAAGWYVLRVQAGTNKKEYKIIKE